MTDYAGLDYETWSRTNLPERGLHNYVTDPEFKPLLASIADEYVVGTYDFVFNCYWAKGYMQEKRPDDRDIIDAFEWDLLNGRYAAHTIMAHNVGFERAVTKRILQCSDNLLKRMQDSAVDSRLLGVESKLEVASRQLTNSHKLEVGKELIMLFCVPNEQYPDGPTPELIEQHGHMDKWMEFIDYCEMDARGSRDIRLKAHEILDDLHPGLIEREAQFEWDCYRMNQNGWHVDKPLVQKMKQRSWANGIIAQRAFVNETEDQINFNSHQQLKRYLENRGVKAKSLDKYHLPLVLERVKKRIAKYEEDLTDEDRKDHPSITRAIGMLKEAEALLETKLEIGGSTLSKLPTILNLMDGDHIVRDQYMHLGAGQTFRTTGKGIQMQNLKKLQVDGDDNVRDTSTVYDLQVHWSNGDFANQLRQVFTSRHPEGEIIVGDYSSVESRALAWEAQEDWKIESYREGKDIYKVLASKYFGIEYDEVSKTEHRPRGKYTELSCGYQASGKALQEFMFRLGYTIDLMQAAEDVNLWREACPNIVELWELLDGILKESVRLNRGFHDKIGNGLSVKTTPFTLPSVEEVHPGSISLAIQILLPDGTPFVTRFIHGLYLKEQDNGRSAVCYYKPTERNNGPLWRAINQTMSAKKSKELGREVEILYSVYGGKLAGILTQSFCREMFMEGKHYLFELIDEAGAFNMLPVGEFHDEIAVDWFPAEGGVTKEEAYAILEKAMSMTRIEGFPLKADIKGSYRYIK